MSAQPAYTDAARAFTSRMLGGADPALAATNPELVERIANFAFDEVVEATKDALSERQRLLCWIATSIGCQGTDVFSSLASAALNLGIEATAIREVTYQAVTYLGIARVWPMVRALDEVLAEHGYTLPLEDQATTTPDEASRYEGGEQAQMAAIGPHAKGYRDRGNPDYPHINHWLQKNCFGDWYTRDGLTIAEREMCTFCYIAAQGGCENQLRAHVAANVQCGNDRAFLIAVVSNNVPFIGYPRSLNAMAIVEEVTGAKD